MKAIRDFLKLLFFKPSSGLPLSILRIGLGVIMLIQTAELIQSIRYIPGSFGFLAAARLDSMTNTDISRLMSQWVMAPEIYAICIKAVFILHVVALLGMTLGFCSRMSTFFVWISFGNP